MTDNNKYKQVSILTPVYNGEKYLNAFLRSIYNQTYPNLQLIVVNDGSTDNTKEILYLWKKKFEDKDIEFTILFQENLGASKALSNGFDLCNGDYFVWIDSDDELSKSAIEKRVRILEDNESDSFVMDRAVFKNENNNTVGLFNRKKADDLFWDFIRERNVFFSGGVYMLRMVQAKEVFLNNIYHSSGGQNWQILLPITYKYKVILNPESNYIYRVHSSSHSQKSISCKDKINRFKEHEKIIIKTLKNMNLLDNELKKGIELARISKYIKICDYLLSINEKELFRLYFRKLSYQDLKCLSFRKNLKFTYFRFF